MVCLIITTTYVHSPEDNHNFVPFVFGIDFNEADFGTRPARKVTTTNLGALGCDVCCWFRILLPAMLRGVFGILDPGCWSRVKCCAVPCYAVYYYTRRTRFYYCSPFPYIELSCSIRSRYLSLLGKLDVPPGASRGRHDTFGLSEMPCAGNNGDRISWLFRFFYLG